MAAISSSNVIQATCNAPWEVAITPFRITDQIYYIGNIWVGAYLIDTGDGLILLDTMCAETAYLMVDAIYRLGYKPEQIKYILLSHAHFDHTGGAQMLKKLSGGKIFLSNEDDEFRFDQRAANAAASKPADLEYRTYDYDIDFHYDDHQPIILGNVRIDTLLTPGHTPGVTTFFIHITRKDGSIITAAMHGGVGVLTMSDAFFAESGLPASLRDRFIADCEKMKRIDVDICLPSHPAHFPGDFFGIREKDSNNPEPFLDRMAWSQFLTERADLARNLISKP